MCGIIAQVGKENLISNLISGIKMLEYRGYDSFGIMTVGEERDVNITKKTGSIKDDLTHDYKHQVLGMAHTRWATHGCVSIVNAHPRCSYDNSIFVVHNGIYEDSTYESDTLGVANMIANSIIHENCMNEQGKIRLMSMVMKEITGDNAVVFYCRDIPDKLFYFVTGDGCLYKNGNIIMSEPADDSKWEKVAGGKLHILQNTAPTFSFAHSDRQTNMMDEIVEQIDIFRNYEFLNRRNVYEVMDDNYNKRLPIHTIGCGSSYIAGLMGSYIIDSRVFNAGEYLYFNKNGNVKLIISQSGETADIRGLDNDDIDIVITNNEQSSIGSRAKILLPLDISRECAVAATKTFTMSCARIAEFVSDKLVCTTEFANCIEQLIGLDFSKYSDILAHHPNVLVLGTLYDYPIALEGALKLKEVAYIHAEAMISSEMKHGPIALIEDGMPCIFVMSKQDNPRLIKKTIANMHEISSRGGYPIVIAEQGIETGFDTITVPTIFHKPEYGKWYFQALANIVPLQIMAYQVALLKGHDPNRPRSLAKCVTV